MSNRSTKRLLVVTVAMAATAVAGMPAAWATLGEPETSAATDAEQLKAQVHASDHAAYRVQAIQLPSGTEVNEYSVPGGNVFAVTWRGPSMPDLAQTLGSYFPVYTAAAKANPASRHFFEVRSTSFVMQSGGRMRAFSGRAYLPQALPPGVAVEELP